jgi:hypothetical protein
MFKPKEKNNKKEKKISIYLSDTSEEKIDLSEIDQKIVKLESMIKNVAKRTEIHLNKLDLLFEVEKTKKTKQSLQTSKINKGA